MDTTESEHLPNMAVPPRPLGQSKDLPFFGTDVTTGRRASARSSYLRYEQQGAGGWAVWRLEQIAAVLEAFAVSLPPAAFGFALGPVAVF
jgi:hypothetical protein